MSGGKHNSNNNDTYALVYIRTDTQIPETTAVGGRGEGIVMSFMAVVV